MRVCVFLINKTFQVFRVYHFTIRPWRTKLESNQHIIEVTLTHHYCYFLHNLNLLTLYFMRVCPSNRDESYLSCVYFSLIVAETGLEPVRSLLTRRFSYHTCFDTSQLIIRPSRIPISISYVLTIRV